MTLASDPDRGAPSGGASLSWGRLFFTFGGRISRRTYLWRGQLVLSLLSIAVLFAGGKSLIFLRRQLGENEPLATALTLACAIAAVAVFLWAIAALLVKRLHDRKRSGWLALLALVPFVNLWIMVETALLRGTPGPNSYGATPMEFSTARAGRPAPGWGAFILDVAYLVVLWVFLMAFRTFAYEPFNIPAASMTPTLLVGDYFFVSKYSYGYGRYSFPLGLASFSGRLGGREPRRGDVIVFQLPRQPSVAYVKRVVGLPGDRVQMVGGRLILNGEPARLEPAGELVVSREFPAPVPRFRETLPGGIFYEILQYRAPGRFDDTPAVDVPPGQLFVLGDFRSNSLDSRIPAEQGGVGLVPYDNLIGQADFLYFSTAGFRRTLTEIR